MFPIWSRTLTAVLLLCLPPISPARDTSSTASQPGADRPPVVRRLAPLSVRGVNYYPRLTSWGTFWTSTPPEVIERDMALAASLHVNTVRVFVHWGEGLEKAGLITGDGHVSPAYLGKFEHLLQSAWRHGIRVIVCFEFERAKPRLHIIPRETWQRAMAAFVTPHKDDGRILLWDLMNEPERHKWSPEVRRYLREALVHIRRLDPYHLTTIGIAYQVDHLGEVVLPDVIQYHEYAPEKELREHGAERVQMSVWDMCEVGATRPVLIGEFGSSTGRDPEHGAGAEWIRLHGDRSKTETEAGQLWRYEQIFRAAEKEGIAGVVSWCLFDYPTEKSGWLTPEESQFGLVRMDDTLKPAALLLRERFEKWSSRVPDGR